MGLDTTKPEKFYREKMVKEYNALVKKDGTLKDPLKMQNVRKVIPEHCFQKNALLAMPYFFFDFAMVFLLEYGFYNLSNSAFYTGLPLLLRCAFIFVFWQLTGFFGWCIFVVGHDCGHGTFAQSYIINSIIGHICHGVLMVPFWPWARSHHLHHLNHNHVDNDYSHPWILEPSTSNIFILSTPFARKCWDKVLCYIAFPMYLIAGMPDGSHILPIGGGRLYQNTKGKEKIQCCVSSFVCMSFLVLFARQAGSASQLCLMFGGPWIIFCWWLLTVTHFHHHQVEGSTVYDDSTFSYMKGALLTIDRDYGSIINYLSHHITDCHVVHHIWFLKMPHYRLNEASKAVRAHFTKNGFAQLAEVRPTKDFYTRIHKSFSYYEANARLHSLKKQT